MKGNVLIITGILIVLVATIIPIYTIFGGVNYRQKIEMEELDALRVIDFFNIMKSSLGTMIRLNSAQAMFNIGGCDVNSEYWYNLSNDNTVGTLQIPSNIHVLKTTTNPFVCVPRLQELGKIWAGTLRKSFLSHFSSNNINVNLNNVKVFSYPEFVTGFDAICTVSECKIKLTDSAPNGFPIISNKYYEYSAKNSIITIKSGTKEYVFGYSINGQNENVIEKQNMNVNKHISGSIILKGITSGSVKGTVEYILNLSGSKINTESKIAEKTSSLKTAIPRLFRGSDSYSDVIEKIIKDADDISQKINLRYETTDKNKNEFVIRVKNQIIQYMKDETGGSVNNGVVTFSVNGYNVDGKIERINLIAADSNDKLVNRHGIILRIVLKFIIYDKEENYPYWDESKTTIKPFTFYGKANIMKIGIECENEKGQRFSYLNNDDLFCINNGNLYTCNLGLKNLAVDHKISVGKIINIDTGNNCNDITNTKCYECTKNGFCSKLDTYSDNSDLAKNCCKSLGFTWDKNGFCKNDNYCDSSKGETSKNSNDCKSQT